ncbi:Ankyrin repeat-containing protein isoform 2 [Cladophialophora immunda]|nr:Ankyrin repeat-containing protein isoform 2 [Cladophialophora immunda]
MQASASHQENVLQSTTNSGSGNLFAANSFNTGGGSITFGHERKELEDRCLRGLFQTNPLDDLRSIQKAKSKLEGTCEWLLLREEYKNWVSGDGPWLLQLEGAPGIGKTVLATFLVNELTRRAETTPEMTFAYFFCDNKHEARKTATSILRGLIWQLLRRHEDLFEHILSDFKSQQDRLFENFEALWRILSKMLRDPKSGDAFLLIDALDECEELSREGLIDSLELLANEACDDCKVLITCRPGYDKRNKLDEISTCIRVDTGKINQDLSYFISSRVDDISRRKKWHPALQGDVQMALNEKAQGTFLWVSLVVKDLERTKKHQVRQKLETLPTGLDEIYDRILSGIESERAQDALLVLQCIIAARRPLTTSELAMAFILGVCESEANELPSEDKLDEFREIHTMCGDIVYVDRDDETVNLIHQSAKDYLLTDKSQAMGTQRQYAVVHYSANCLLFRACWAYLSMKEFDQGNMIIYRDPGNRLRREYVAEYLEREHCFLRYASEEWRKHAVAAYPAIVENLVGFDWTVLGNTPNLRDAWLITASEKGQNEVVVQLLNKGADLEVKDGIRNYTPLSLAASNGHQAVVQLLLENGADLEVKDGIRNYTPLSLAAENGHQAVVRLLLEKAADLKVNDNTFYRTPLSLAAKNGHQAVVRLLLENGADLEVKGGHLGQTPLSQAAANGREVVVKLLLGKGAELEAKDKSGQTVLLCAVENGHKEVVQLLLEKGAELKARDNNGQTALLLAADYGREEVVRLLLEKGTELEAKDDYGQTALLLAARNGYEEVVRLLLEKGAKLESKNNSGRTALWWAARNGHEEVVQLLLEKGAELEAKDDNGQTALLLAADYGREGVVRLLLEKGAELEAKDRWGFTALWWAARNGRWEVVKLLFEKGASLRI